MTTIFIRTIIIYVVLLTSMRLMGKRQVGELEISDLITTLLVSEIASLPLTDLNIPVSHAIIPIILLLTFEVVSSTLLMKFPPIKKFISTRPTTLIDNGRLCPEQMKKVRLTADELISEIRQGGISDIAEVQYAILEQNGRISIIQKPEFRPLSAKDMNIHTENRGIYHIIIENGHVCPHGLEKLKLDRKKLSTILYSRRYKQKDIYIMMINDGGDVMIVPKEKK